GIVVSKLAGIAVRALDMLDFAVVVLDPDLDTVLLKNQKALELLGIPLPPSVYEAIQQYVEARLDARATPPPMRISVGDRSLYLRVVPSVGDPPLEIVFLREEVLR